MNDSDSYVPSEEEKAQALVFLDDVGRKIKTGEVRGLLIVAQLGHAPNCLMLPWGGITPHAIIYAESMLGFVKDQLFGNIQVEQADGRPTLNLSPEEDR